MPGGYGAISSALTRPTASAAGTVSWEAKKALRGSVAVAGSTVHAAAGAICRGCDGHSAPVHAPGGGGPLLGLGQQPAVLLHGVKAREQRHVTAHHVARQVRALLVAGDGERQHGAVSDGGAEPQPGVQQRRVAGQAERVARIALLRRHEAPPARKRPTVSATATG